MQLNTAAGRLDRLLPYISDGCSVFDGEGRCLQVNPAAAVLLGRHAEQLLGRDRLDVFSQAPNSPFDEAWSRAASTGEPVEVDLVLARGRLSLRIFREPDGRLVLLREAASAGLAPEGQRADHERYRLAASTGDLWDVDFASGRSMISPQLKRQLGYTALELPDRAEAWPPLLHDDDRERALAAMREHLKHGTPFDVEYRVRTRSGEWRWMHARGQATWDSQGRPTYMAGTLFDVSARRAAEQAAVRLADFYAALSRTHRAIVRVHDLDALFQEVCRAAVEHGHARMAYIVMREGQALRPRAWAGPAETFVAELPLSLDPSVPEGRGPIATAMLQGRHYVANDLHADPRTLPWRERAARIGSQATAAFPIRRAGAVVGAFSLHTEAKGFFDERLIALLDEMVDDLSFAMDNADREAALVAAERQAQSGLERFRKVFHAAPLAASIAKLDEGRLLDVNAAYALLYGRPREQLLGRTTTELGMWSPAEREAFVTRLRSERQVRDFETRMVSADGQSRSVLISTEMIDFAEQACLVTLVNDITSRRLAEAAEQARRTAEAASRAKTEFLSRMSHELRTPLNAVLGFAQLLQTQTDPPLPPAQRAQVEQIGQAGWHLLALINDVLDVARIEAGTMQLETCAVDLHSLFDEVLEMSRSQARHHGVRLEPAQGSEGTGQVWGDALRLRQVLLNLVSNAVKYNRPGGSVRLTASRQRDEVLIEVADDGLGIGSEQQAHLFEPFNRLGRERGTVEGTGIGLVVSRELVLLMGGRIDITSEPGTGTRVRLWLPARPGAPAQHMPAPAAEAVPLVAAPAVAAPEGTVLYIEDNEVNVMVVQQLLARWPSVSFEHALDGRSGIAAAHRLHPDLVLLDMRLPDIDGTEVLRTLRADAATRSLRIVALSASAMPDEVTLARAFGANDYWTKPLDFARFLTQVALLLAAPADV